MKKEMTMDSSIGGEKRERKGGQKEKEGENKGKGKETDVKRSITMVF